MISLIGMQLHAKIELSGLIPDCVNDLTCPLFNNTEQRPHTPARQE